MTTGCGTIESPNSGGGTAQTARHLTPKIGASMPREDTASCAYCGGPLNTGRKFCSHACDIYSRPKTPPADRFMAKVEQTPTCWVWTAAVQTTGYGSFHVDGVRVLAHRWSFEHHVGPIPDDLTIDHLCRNRRCVNPEHLEVVTLAENSRRMMAWRRAMKEAEAA